LGGGRFCLWNFGRLLFGAGGFSRLIKEAVLSEKWPAGQASNRVGSNIFGTHAKNRLESPEIDHARGGM
jgi:hypothetical protein